MDEERKYTLPITRQPLNNTLIVNNFTLKKVI